jgi:DNA-binding NtrC family response regulator
MIQSQATKSAYERPEHADGNGSPVKLTLPLRARSSWGHLNCPTVLVASSDENVLQKLAEITVQCGLATFLAFTVGESKRILDRQRVCLVVCDDRLIDGKYEDILNETVRLLLKTPLIVVSPTGDWRDYLKAIGAGAFDYLAYPPIPGDLPRSISNALTLRTDGGFQDATIKFSNSAREGIL